MPWTPVIKSCIFTSNVKVLPWFPGIILIGLTKYPLFLQLSELSGLIASGIIVWVVRRTAPKSNKCPASFTNQRCVKSQKYLPLLPCQSYTHTSYTVERCHCLFPTPRKAQSVRIFSDLQTSRGWHTGKKMKGCGFTPLPEMAWDPRTGQSPGSSYHPICNSAKQPLSSPQVWTRMLGFQESTQRKVSRLTKGSHFPLIFMRCSDIFSLQNCCEVLALFLFLFYARGHTYEVICAMVNCKRARDWIQVPDQHQGLQGILLAYLCTLAPLYAGNCEGRCKVSLTMSLLRGQWPF